jgi:hypothetical protein|uniref:Uncharacterized protein n=1 Tax=Zea mays TaxID=4577 RepID=C4J2J1_MAIZE|nr:unknown [Zea mays]
MLLQQSTYVTNTATTCEYLDMSYKSSEPLLINRSTLASTGSIRQLKVMSKSYSTKQILNPASLTALVEQ